MSIPEDTFKELEAKHGEIVEIETKAGPCAFRPCKRDEYDRYQSLIFEKKTQSKAAEVLVRATVVYPSKEDFTRMLDRYPFIVSTCFTAVAELSGLNMEPEVKKSEIASAKI